MFFIIGLIIGSVPIGYFLRKNSHAVNFTNRALVFVIYALLFFIGLGLGSNEELLLRLSKLGVQGIVIGVLSALGSVFAVCFVFKSFFSIISTNKDNKS